MPSEIKDKPGMRFSDHIAEHSKTIGENLVRLNFLLDNIDFDDKFVLFSGCGTGYEVEYLAERTHSKKIIGIDISKEAIDHAKKNSKHDNCEYQTYDATQEIFPPENFDIVVTLEVLEHISQQGVYIKELNRVLKKEGILALSTPNRMIFSAGYPKSRNLTHVKELDLSELRKLISDHFSRIEIYGQYLKDSKKAEQHLESVKDYHERRFYYDTKDKIVNFLRWLKIPVIIYRKVREPGPPQGHEIDDFAIDKDRMDWAIWHIVLCRKE